MVNRFVVYQPLGSSWNGAVEITTGWWLFKKTQHAPVISGETAEEVFAFLQKTYPNSVIAYDPAVSERYSS